MRVITGLAKGKRLNTLKGNDVRPTADRIKEAIFSAIQFNIEGARFLDLFSGSGQMGIEALSRLASKTFFVDSSRSSIEVIKSNLKATGLTENAKVFNMDAESFLKTTDEEFDIAFLDPPYANHELEKILPLVENSMSKTGFIICESPLDENLPEKVNNFSLYKQYKYGKIKITIYSKKDV